MNFQKKVLLKNYSNYRIGGPAEYFTEVSSNEKLKEALRLAKSQGLNKIAILGGGTKVLISDEGFDGLVIYNKMEGIAQKGNDLNIGSGVLIKDLLDYCIKNSLSGLEWAGGLPGTIGGAVRGNAGAFMGETKDSVFEVRSLDRKTLREVLRNNAQCQFGYRSSIFKSGVARDEFITSVTLKLGPGEKNAIKERINKNINYRETHQPLDLPSLGSTFKNVPLNSLSDKLQKQFSSIVKVDPFPIIPATKLLSLSGLKGQRVGGAMISDKHPNFILNIDNATVKDVKALIEIAKQTVKEKFDISLQEEIIYLQ
jgi:UDP-N-acetylmuramate dehydrogenase